MSTITTELLGSFLDTDVELPQSMLTLGAVMEHLYVDSAPESRWIAENTFSCDGGAVAICLVASALKLHSQLYVGLYWHSDVELRADLMGEIEPDEDTLRDIRKYMMDEHHHWAWVEGFLVDPNGPVRDEPYIQLSAGASDETATNYLGGGEGRYEYGPHVPNLVYDAEDSPEHIADDLYPGLREAVVAAVAAVHG